MSRSRSRFRFPQQVAAFGALSVLLVLLLLPVDGFAAVSVRKASLSAAGTLSVEGRGAIANATITVSSPESTATGKANSKGEFKFSASGYRSSTCTATIGDGSTPVIVTLSGCTVAAPPPPPPPDSGVVITADGPLGPGFVGSDFTTFATLGTVIALGPPALGPVDFRVSAGQLPAGLRLADVNTSQTPAKHTWVAIVGVPTSVGTTTFSVTLTDANGIRRTGTYTIVINPAQTLVINLQTPWSPVAGSFSNLWIDGAGGSRPYRWAVIAGQQPAGMSLVQDNPAGPLVRITGTPTSAGASTFTLRLTDATGATVSRVITVTVA